MSETNLTNNFLKTRFVERATKAGATVLEVNGLTGAAQAIAETVKTKGEGPLVATPDLLEEPGLTGLLPLEPAVDEFKVAGSVAGVSPGSFGIAETGSIVYAANARLDRLVAMFSPIHFALVYAENIVPDLVVAGGKIRELQVQEGRKYVSFVTGPSRTADIERVLTIGVQGPKELYIVLINGETES
jgi:L-lactate dehydrogenase complex protein LldG